MESKICTKCGAEKELSEFPIRSTSKDNHRKDCKSCHSASNKKYREENIEKYRLYGKEHYLKNKEKLLLKKQEWRKNNPEKYKSQTKKWYEKTKDVQNLKKKLWITENRETYNGYFKTMKKNNPIYKLKCDIRSRINGFLKINNITKTNKTFDIVGCTPEYLKEHLEKQFTEGMDWKNHGLFGWHIDHIVPLSSAANDEDLYKLCHYSNLQPLWFEDNIKKGNKLL